MCVTNEALFVMAQQPEDFSGFLEKYSEYLTDASNKEDLLQLGRRLLGANSTHSDDRPSLKLLNSKTQELSTVPEQREVRSRVSLHTHHSIGHHEAPTQMSPDQIMAEIMQLQQRNVTLRAMRSDLETKRTDMTQEYERLIKNGVTEKEQLHREIRDLTRELAASLVRQRGPEAAPRGALPVINELSELNRQVLQKISGFKEATRDALSHCERAVLDRYKPRMEEILARIYDNAKDLPASEIRERFDGSSDEIEAQIETIRSELEAENVRNERLQLETRQLEDKLSVQRDEVARMKKEHTTLGHEVTFLNDIAVQEIAMRKTQYQRMLRDQEDERAEISSARAVAVTTASDRRQPLKRVPSKKFKQTREMKNPTIPSVEDFIEIEKNALMARVRKGNHE